MSLVRVPVSILMTFVMFLPLVYEGVVTFRVFFLARVILLICSLCSRFVTDK